MFKGYEHCFNLAEGRSNTTQPTALAPFLLNLPKIAPNVPVRFTQSAHPSIALLASRMGQVGVIGEDDIGDDKTIDGVIKSVMSRELAKAFGKLSLIDLSVSIHDGAVEQYADIDDEERVKSDNGRFHFTIDCETIPTVFIGDRLNELEAIRPGLGETVYAVLLFAGEGSMNLFSFYHVFENLPWMYYLDERGGDDGDEEDDDDEGDDQFDGMPTKKDLLENVPEWAGEPKLKLTPRQLQALIRKETTPQWARDILNATLDAANAWKKGHNRLGIFSYGESQPVYTMAYLRFNEKDQMEMIMDDYINQANASSDCYTQLSHFELIYHLEAGEFSKWWNGILDGCRLVGSIDTLMTLLCNGKFRYQNG